MNIEFPHVVMGIAIGIGATLVMDVWYIVLKRVLNIPLPQINRVRLD